VPPRFAYWTILIEGLPTAFRAAERDELLPTFKRLQEKHKDAAMRWFARGQLWESPEAARAALIEARRAEHPARGRDWRPGGDHRDPRQKFIDAKKTRNLDRRKQRFERRQEEEAPPRRPDGPAGWKERPQSQKPPAARREWTDRPKSPKPAGPSGWKKRPQGQRPDGPRGWKDRPQGPKPEARREWKERPPGPKPEGRREWNERPRGPRPPGKPSAPRGPRGPRPTRGPRGPKR
jgi:23S rRNA pseudouridine2605 synthase